jgi:hypothetical protein
MARRIRLNGRKAVSTSTPQLAVNCPCGAQPEAANTAVCSNCGGIRGASAASAFKASHQALLDRPTFRLESLLLLMTLFGLWLTIARSSLELGVFVAVLAVPALLRTAAEARVHKLNGAPRGVVRKVAWFVVSLGIVVLVYLLGLAGFTLTTLVVFAIGTIFGAEGAVLGLVIGAMCGLMVGIMAAGHAARYSWPRSIPDDT